MTMKIPIPHSLATLDLSSPSSFSSSSSSSTTTTNTDTSESNDDSFPSTILTPQTLPSPTRKAFLAHLHRTSSIPPLDSLLTTTLHKPTSIQPSRAADWPSRVHALALELLRSGACDPTFQDLMSEITRRALVRNGERREAVNGGKVGKGIGMKGRVGTIVLPNGSYGEDGLPDVRIPGEVVQRGIEFLEERVKGNIEVSGAKNGDGREEGTEDD